MNFPVKTNAEEREGGTVLFHYVKVHGELVFGHPPDFYESKEQHQL